MNKLEKNNKTEFFFLMGITLTSQECCEDQIEILKFTCDFCTLGML